MLAREPGRSVKRIDMIMRKGKTIKTVEMQRPVVYEYSNIILLYYLTIYCIIFIVLGINDTLLYHNIYKLYLFALNLQIFFI